MLRPIFAKSTTVGDFLELEGTHPLLLERRQRTAPWRSTPCSSRSISASSLFSPPSRKPYDRIAMHGVRRELLRQQAESIGLPLHEVFIPPQCVNPSTNRAWKKPSASSTTKASAKSPLATFSWKTSRLPREKPRPHRHDRPLPHLETR